MNRLTNHQTPMQHKRKSYRMHLQTRPSTPNTQRHRIMRPALASPEGHDAGEADARGDGRALEVL